MIKDLLDDTLREECGVFGIFDHADAVPLTYYGLNALQHRGQEGAGIVAGNRHRMLAHRNLGLVNDVFDDEILRKLQDGHVHAIGHVRYSTTGGNLLVNVQPFLISSNAGSFAVAHNGNLVNARDLRLQLENKGSIFQSTSDTEVIAHLIRHSRKPSDAGQILDALQSIEGAFSLVILTQKALYAAVDAFGFRPLSLGRMDNGAYVVASETCALDVVGAHFLHDIRPGTLLEISEAGIHTFSFADPSPAKCSMEYLYFAQPNSIIKNVSVYEARMRMGAKLWDTAPVDADVVIGVPESGSLAAMGLARQSGIRAERGLIKNRYIGRSFIQPTQELRDNAVRLKLSVVKHLIEGKRVIVVDDSIVRGTTSRKIVRLLRDAGASEVHFRSAAPPIMFPCFYGIDTSTQKELLAANMSIDAMKRFMEVDTLAFLTVADMQACITENQDGAHPPTCTACFTGTYPTQLYKDMLHFQEKC